MLLRRHLGKASLWSILQSSSTPYRFFRHTYNFTVCITEIKQLSSSMDYNKYYNFVPNILGLSSNYLTLYKFFNLSQV